MARLPPPLATPMLSVFICFPFMLNLRGHFAGDISQKIFFVATVHTNTFAHALLGLIR